MGAAYARWCNVSTISCEFEGEFNRWCALQGRKVIAGGNAPGMSRDDITDPEGVGFNARRATPSGSDLYFSLLSGGVAPGYCIVPLRGVFPPLAPPTHSDSSPTRPETSRGEWETSRTRPETSLTESETPRIPSETSLTEPETPRNHFGASRIQSGEAQDGV